MSAVKTTKAPTPVVDENSAGSEIDASAGEEVVKEVEKADPVESDDKVEKDVKVEKAEVATAATGAGAGAGAVKQETVDCSNLSLLLPVEGVPITTVAANVTAPATATATATVLAPKVPDTEAVEVCPLSCRVLSYVVLSSIVLSCRVLSCRVLSCRALSCRV
jgi:hypothetical protein